MLLRNPLGITLHHLDGSDVLFTLSLITFDRVKVEIEASSCVDRNFKKIAEILASVRGANFD